LNHYADGLVLLRRLRTSGLRRLLFLSRFVLTVLRLAIRSFVFIRVLSLVEALALGVLLSRGLTALAAALVSRRGLSSGPLATQESQQLPVQLLLNKVFD